MIMNCKCIETINSQLAKDGLELEQHAVIDTTTFESSTALALIGIPTKRGVKKRKLFLNFCPFCGKRDSVKV